MNVIIITGASSGLGKEFALQLDSFGADEIWAIALGEEKLIELNKQLKTPSRIFALDLTDAKSFKVFYEQLEELKPNVLWVVNCSGFCNFGAYNEIPIEKNINLIDLNCSALVRTTELCLPFMQKGARVVEIASMAGFQSTPYMNVYGASKAFVISYSRGLSAELKHREISVTCVCPLWTNTNFVATAEQTSREAVTNLGKLCSPKDVVKKAIKDAKKRKEISTFGAKSKFMRFLVKILPHKLICHIWLKQQGKK